MTECIIVALVNVNVNVNVNLYSASSQKSASNALNVPSILIKKDTSSVYDENSQFACPAHANYFGTSSIMSLVQRQRRCDGRIRIELKPWNNELNEYKMAASGTKMLSFSVYTGVYTAQTDNPVPGLSWREWDRFSGSRKFKQWSGYLMELKSRLSCIWVRISKSNNCVTSYALRKNLLILFL